MVSLFERKKERKVIDQCLYLDEDMLKGVQLFFNNKFSEAKAIFETKSKE
jgi:hypothetical protein